MPLVYYIYDLNDVTVGTALNPYLLVVFVCVFLLG